MRRAVETWVRCRPRVTYQQSLLAPRLCRHDHRLWRVVGRRNHERIVETPRQQLRVRQVRGVHARERRAEPPGPDRRRHPTLERHQSAVAGVPGGAGEVQASATGRRTAHGATVRTGEARDAQDLRVHARAWNHRLPRPDNEAPVQPCGLRRGRSIAGASCSRSRARSTSSLRRTSRPRPRVISTEPARGPVQAGAAVGARPGRARLYRERLLPDFPMGRQSGHPDGA